MKATVLADRGNSLVALKIPVEFTNATITSDGRFSDRSILSFSRAKSTVVDVWDLQGCHVSKLEHSSEVVNVCVCENSPHPWVCLTNGDIVEWNVREGLELQRKNPFECETTVVDFKMKSDGTAALFLTTDTLDLYDLETKKVQSTSLPSHYKVSVTKIFVNADWKYAFGIYEFDNHYYDFRWVGSNLVIFTINDSALHSWSPPEMSTGKSFLSAHLSMSPCGILNVYYVRSSYEGVEVIDWDRIGGRVVRRYKIECKEQLVFSPCGRYAIDGVELVTIAGLTRTRLAFQLPTEMNGKEVYLRRDFAPGEEYVIGVNSGVKCICIWKTLPCEPPIYRMNQRQAVGAWCAGRLWTATSKTISRWDADLSGSDLSIAVDIDDKDVPLFEVSLDGQELAKIEGSCVRIVDVDNGAQLQEFQGHTGKILCMSADGQGIVVTGSEDGTVRIWNVKSGTCEHVLSGHDDRVTAVQICHSRDYIVSGSVDLTIRVWRTASGSRVRTLTGHTGRISELAVTADDQFIVSASTEDQSIRVWDLHATEWIRTISTVHMKSMIVSREAPLIYTTHAYGILRVWDVEGRCVQVFEHPYPVLWLSLGKEGVDIFSGSLDYIRHWVLGDDVGCSCAPVADGRKPNKIVSVSAIEDEDSSLSCPESSTKVVPQGDTTTESNEIFNENEVAMASGGQRELSIDPPGESGERLQMDGFGDAMFIRIEKLRRDVKRAYFAIETKDGKVVSSAGTVSGIRREGEQWLVDSGRLLQYEDRYLLTLKEAMYLLESELSGSSSSISATECPAKE